jgi:hypothetical protein
VLLHHVVIVEQPFTGGADVFRPVRGGEPGVRFLEDFAGSVEPPEKRCLSPSPSSNRQALTDGDLPGPLRQALGSKQLAPDGPGEPILAGVRPEQGSEEGEGLARAQRNGRYLEGGVFAGEQGSIMTAR